MHPSRPIAVGNTVSLPLDILAEPGRYENCASVAHAAPNRDPVASNDRDCACADVKVCRDAIIDISTGTRGASMLQPGDSDDDWKVIAAPAGIVPAAAKVIGQSHAGFVTAAPANWISSAFPSLRAEGDYLYELKFSTGSELPFCNLDFEYASDNDVTFFLDDLPIVQTLNADIAAFTKLHQGFGFVSSSGTHVLRARVKNLDGPTSLLVHGRVVCSCFLRLG